MEDEISKGKGEMLSTGKGEALLSERGKNAIYKRYAFSRKIIINQTK